MAQPPNIVFDAHLAETWWRMPKDLRELIVDWMRQEGVNVRDTRRVEVYDDYVLCTELVRDSDRKLIIEGGQHYKTRVVEVPITTQPPTNLHGL